jgi:hypothetical protein
VWPHPSFVSVVDFGSFLRQLPRDSYDNVSIVLAMHVLDWLVWFVFALIVVFHVVLVWLQAVHS